MKTFISNHNNPTLGLPVSVNMIKDYNVTFKCDEAPIKSDSAEDSTGTGGGFILAPPGKWD